MKLLHTLLFTIAFSGTCTVTAQTTQYNPSTESTDSSEMFDYNEDYQKYKKLYIKKLDSESHYKILLLSKNFVNKMNHPKKLLALMYVNNDPLNYIKENLSSTSFESYEAAVAEWNILMEENHKEMEQNKEYYKIRDLVRRKWGSKLLSDVSNEIEMEFPEKFNLLKD